VIGADVMLRPDEIVELVSDRLGQFD
jgi:hypothetical protein